MRDGKVSTLVMIGGNPVVQRPGRSELRRRIARRSRPRFGSGSSTITHPRRATGTCRWRTTSKAGATPKRATDALLRAAAHRPAQRRQDRWRVGHRIRRRAAARTCLEVLALLTQFPNPDEASRSRTTSRPRRPPTRLCARSSPTLRDRRRRPRVRHRVQPLQATRLPARSIRTRTTHREATGGEVDAERSSRKCKAIASSSRPAPTQDGARSHLPPGLLACSTAGSP